MLKCLWVDFCGLSLTGLQWQPHRCLGGGLSKNTGSIQCALGEHPHLLCTTAGFLSLVEDSSSESSWEHNCSWHFWFCVDSDFTLWRDLHAECSAVHCTSCSGDGMSSLLWSTSSSGWEWEDCLRVVVCAGSQIFSFRRLGSTSRRRLFFFFNQKFNMQGSNAVCRWTYKPR